MFIYVTTALRRCLTEIAVVVFVIVVVDGAAVAAGVIAAAAALADDVRRERGNGAEGGAEDPFGHFLYLLRGAAQVFDAAFVLEIVGIVSIVVVVVDETRPLVVGAMENDTTDFYVDAEASPVDDEVTEASADARDRVDGGSKRSGGRRGRVSPRHGPRRRERRTPSLRFADAASRRSER